MVINSSVRKNFSASRCEVAGNRDSKKVKPFALGLGMRPMKKITKSRKSFNFVSFAIREGISLLPRHGSMQ
ncbi:MAG: hypothetical protein CBC90_04885 [Acidimicrobiaceae bacterium TMED130]|nr:MAG: hypothetical protein CBC90_04885 [Acidimicrobiaceae bacterium TMED130]